MAKTYKALYEKPEADLYRDIIFGRRDSDTEAPTTGGLGGTPNRTQPQTSEEESSMFDEYVTPVLEKFGLFSTEPERVADALVRTTDKTEEERSRVLEGWSNLPGPPTRGGSQTELAFSEAARMPRSVMEAPVSSTPLSFARARLGRDEEGRPTESLVPRPRPASIEEENKTEESDFLSAALDEVLASEGLYQNDPEDNGNYRPDGTRIGTMRGITPRALAAYRGIDANTLTADDMRAVTEEEARAIYRQNYYEQPRIDELPRDIQANVMDMYINAGPNAIDILQRLLGVEETSRIDSATLDALEDTTITNDQYADARIAYYQRLAEADPDKRIYINGWTNRANKYRD